MDSRKSKILNMIIKEYVKNSKPVSSKSLAEKFEVSPATIRNEMKELEGTGYLFQPHTSAGRMPTEKAYRFFIKSLGGKPEDPFEKHFNYLFEQVGQEQTKVFIDKEIPLVKTRKFTLIITRCKTSNKRNEFVGLIGPTRMRYDYNISLINRLKELLEDND